MMVNLIAICQNFGWKIEQIKNVYGNIFKKISHTLEFDKNLPKIPGKNSLVFDKNLQKKIQEKL